MPRKFDDSDAAKLGLSEVKEAIGVLTTESEPLRKKDIKDFTTEDVEAFRDVNADLEVLDVRFRTLKELTGIGDNLKEAAEAVKEAKAKSGRSPVLLGGGKETEGESSDDLYLKFNDIGLAFVNSPSFKEYNRASHKSPPVDFGIELLHPGFVSFDAEMKAVLGTDDALGGVDDSFPIENVRLPGILETRTEPRSVAEIIPQASTSQSAIVFMQETEFTNSAAEVEEAGTKPESALDFTEASSPVRKIATVLPVTDELFDDAPAMRGYVNSRLLTMVALRESGQLINGNGIAPNLEGILNVSGIGSQALGGDPLPDAIHKGMTLVRTGSFFEPDYVVMNPSDFEQLRLLRTADGIYIWGNPASTGPATVWGKPILQTTQLAAGTAIVGAFSDSTMIFRRSGVALAVSDSHNDFFVENKLMLRAEERLAFVAFRPAGLCEITGI